MKRVRLVAAFALLLGLSGCSGLQLVEEEPSTASARPTASSTDLIQARRAAGIEDCPITNEAMAPEGGLPDLRLSCLGGGSEVRLASLRGPMLINLWAQWCPPCRAEAGHLSAFASSQDEVAVLGIDYSDPDPALAIEFAQLVAATYPQLADPNEELKAPLGITGIPYSLLIDADGKIVARHPGEFESLEQLQSWTSESLR